ncbi:MAG: hypothetical protein EXR62_05200 [Chloroflexi bacterium]|nr:hypothetical protein [Chloroflexota bacterium]
MAVNRIFLNDVLFSLYASHSLGWDGLNRTGFQKTLYFCATLAELAEIKWEYDFTNAPYGPFNREIHQATDILVHYGYASLSEIVVQADSKLRARYRITTDGENETNRICRLDREKKRLDWITQILKVLDIYGQRIVTKLAYNEPTFSNMRKDNRGGIIDLSSSENRSLELLEVLSDELHRKHSIQLDTMASKLITYFDYLSVGVGREDEK